MGLSAARFAMGPAIKSVMKFLNPGKMTNIEKLLRFGPDTLVGLNYAAQSEGDILDKIIAGGSIALPSVGAGILGGKVAGNIGRKMKLNNQDLSALITMGDFGGSFGGDFLGYPVGQEALRLKNKIGGGSGETPFEQLNREQQVELTKALEAQIMAKYGIAPDYTMQQMGLG